MPLGRGQRPLSLLFDGTAVMFGSWNRHGRLAAVRPRVHPVVPPAEHFAATVHGVLSELACQRLVFALDDVSAHRRKLHPGYKRRRSLCTASRLVFRRRPWEVYPAQAAVMKDVLAFMGVPVVFLKGYEADDVVATYTAQAKAAGHFVRIVGRDKDLMQLVDGDTVLLYDWIGRRFLGEEHVVERFRVEPHLLPDVLALVGDKGSNVPGLRGIGLHTASRLVRHYGGLLPLLDNLETVTPRARRELIRLHAPRLRVFHDMARLPCDAPVAVPLDDLRPPGDIPPLDDVLGFARSQAAMYASHGVPGTWTRPAVST